MASNLTYGRPHASRIRDIPFTRLRNDALIDPENMTCSAFRVNDDVDPINELLCFDTGIRLSSDCGYRLKFVNHHSLLKAGYQVLDIFEPSGEHIFMIKFRESVDISSPFPVPFVVEKLVDGVNFLQSINSSKPQQEKPHVGTEYRPSHVYAPREQSRWG